MLYSDPQLEQQLVAALIQLDEVYTLGERITPRLFINEIYRELAQLALNYYNNYRERIVWPVVAAYLNLVGRSNELDLFEAQWAKLEDLPVLVKPRYLVDSLCTYEYSRRTSSAYETAQELFSQGQLQEALELIYNTASKINQEKYSQEVERGEFLSDAEERLQRIRNMREDPNAFRGILTGINVVDQYAGGTWPGEFCVVFGESSSGKSMALLEIARTAFVHGHVVLVITIEMKKSQWERRLDSRMSHIMADHFKLASLTEQEEQQWLETLSRLSELAADKGSKLFVHHLPYCTPDSVASEVDYCMAQGCKPDIVIVDYLNMMIQGSKSQAYSESQQLGNISRELKALACQYDFGLWTAAQKKTTSYRKGHMDLDDMGYSMQVVHVADTVVGMTYYPDTKELDIALLKQRDGRAFITEKILPDYSRATLDTSRLLGAV